MEDNKKMNEKVKITTLEELKKASIRITGPIGVRVRVRQDGKKTVEQRSIFDPRRDFEEVHFCYRSIYGITAFIEEDVMYVIPTFDEAEQILKERGFAEDLFMKVPFLFSKPIKEEEKWNELLKKFS